MSSLTISIPVTLGGLNLVEQSGPDFDSDASEDADDADVAVVP